jgi:hypothetical protein
MRKLFCTLAGLLAILIFLPAQDKMDSLPSWNQAPEVEFSGFIDAFFAMGNYNSPYTTISPYLFNHNRHQEFNLNLGLIQAKVEHPYYRGMLGIQTGTYAIDNYSAEPEGLKNIFEAYVGINLSQKKELWLDMGIFTSHIGFESAISLDNWTLTRSLPAEHSPYYLAGARLTYSANDRWEIMGVICNGWQRIQGVPNRNYISFGTQVKFTPSEKATLNWSTFIGTDDPEVSRRMRYFNNLFGQFKLSPNFEMILGYDFGYQKQAKRSDEYFFWYSPIAVARYHLSDKWKIGLRAEYFYDPDEVIIPTTNNEGFQVSGLSINFDYIPVKNIAWRIEMKNFQADELIFGDFDKSIPRDSKLILTTSLALRL